MNRAGAASVLLIVLTVASLLGGCPQIGFVGSPQKTFTGREHIVLPAQRPDILDVVAEVGKDLGYSVSHLDKTAGTIGLSSGSSMVTSVLIGKVSRATLRIQLQEEGKALDINVVVSGNFGTAEQDAATRLIDDFKAKLLPRLGSSAPGARGSL